MITSVANQKIKRIVQLNKKSSERKKENVFIVEGMKMFMEAPEELLEEIYLSESLAKELTGSLPGSLKEQNAGENHAGIWDKVRKTGYEVVADDVFVKMSDTRTPQGILCVVRQKSYTLSRLKAEASHFLILENLQDPGNLGTIMRTGEGAGITGVIMSRDTVDIYNPKTIRATMGSIYRVPFLYTEDIKETIRQIKGMGIAVYAAHLKGDKSYDRFDYTRPTAFLIGNEGNGLTEETAALADAYIRIPMEGKLESLNAAVAAALLMYETARQRRM